MKKNSLLYFCVGIAFCSALLSCTKEKSAPVKGERMEKTFGAGYCCDDVTRVALVPGGLLSWEINDKINWYMCKASTAFTSGINKGIHVVPENGSTTRVPISYSYGDEDMVMGYVLGNDESSVGGSNYTYNYIQVANGVNTVQNGKFEDNTICKTCTPVTSDLLTFKNVQSFISFSLNSIEGGETTFTKFTVESVDGYYIAGNVQYAMKDDGQTVNYGTKVDAWKKITVVPTEPLTVAHKYYVAILPRQSSYSAATDKKYAGGLRISFYDADHADAIAYVDTKTGIEIKQGDICDLGVLDPYKKIYGTKIPFIWPEESSIVNKGGLKQTKKLWVEFEPSDVTDITYTCSETGKVTFTKGPDEQLDGKWCKTVIVDPIDSYTSGDLTITAKLTGGRTAATVTSTIHVGDFIDLGFEDGTLWAYSNVAGSGTTSLTTAASTKGSLALTANYDDYGGYYQWGRLENLPETWTNNDYSLASGATWTTFGGKYNSTSATTLEQKNDWAWMINSAWRTPTPAQFKTLLSECIEEEYVTANVQNCHRFTSKHKGFTDMAVYLPATGNKVAGGSFAWQGGILYYYSNTVCTDTKPCINIPSWAYCAAYQCCYFYLSLQSTANGAAYYRYSGGGVRPVKKVTRPTDRAYNGKTAWKDKYTILP